jgi:hypothetical protein
MSQMHNCKDSRDALLEAALRGWIPGPDEFPGCSSCREELASLRGAVQLTDSAIQMIQPKEEFWIGYDARLRRHLSEGTQPGTPAQPRTLGSLVRQVVTTSVPIPVPLALTILGFIAFSIFFMLTSRTRSGTAPAPLPPAIVERVVEVPVVQQKIIPRVVYRDRSTSRPAVSSSLAMNPATDRNRDSAPAPESLDGFKPVHEAKLTLIKGNRDEK